jgi:hypothetical protein
MTSAVLCSPPPCSCHPVSGRRGHLGVRNPLVVRFGKAGILKPLRRDRMPPAGTCRRCMAQPPVVQTRYAGRCHSSTRLPPNSDRVARVARRAIADGVAQEPDRSRDSLSRIVHRPRTTGHDVDVCFAGHIARTCLTIDGGQHRNNPKGSIRLLSASLRRISVGKRGVV